MKYSSHTLIMAGSWFAALFLMAVHIIGYFLAWWDATHITWWAAFAVMLFMNVLGVLGLYDE